MQTKQQRLRYGEDLRREIQMKEEKKRAEVMERRGFALGQGKPQISNSYTQSNPVSIATNPVSHNPISHNPPVNNPIVSRNPITHNISPAQQNLNRKEHYQKQLETDLYFPFGKAGGGAPNRRQDNKQPEQEQNQGYEYTQAQQPVSAPSMPAINLQGYSQPPQYYLQPPNGDYNYGMGSQNTQMQQNYQPSQQYGQPHYGQNVSRGVAPEYGQQFQAHQGGPQPPNNYAPQYYQHPLPVEQYRGGQEKEQYPRESMIRQQSREDSRVSQRRNTEREGRSQKDIPSEDKVMKHVRGHNILQQENELQSELNNRQQKKDDIQRELIKQIEQKQRAKKEEEERTRQEELKLEEQNKRYMEMEKKKFKDQEDEKRRKQEAKKEAQVNSLLMRERMEKQAQQAKKRKRPEVAPPVYEPPKIEVQVEERRAVPRERSVRQQPQEQVDYQDVEKAFDVSISRDFIRQEKEKDEERMMKDKHLNELKRNVRNMKDQVVTQGELYKIEIEKAKLEIERARLEKEKVEQEVQRLKHELNSKNMEEHYKLQRAFDKTEPREAPSPSPKPLRPQQEQLLVKKTYNYEKQPQRQHREYELQSQLVENRALDDPNSGTMFEEGLRSLVGETVKVPVNINSNKLTMSNIGEYDINIRNHKGQEKKPNQWRGPQKDIIDEEEEDPVRREYRRHLQQDDDDDELGKFVKEPPRQAAKWGQLSSVDSEGTREIERLLKQQYVEVEREAPKRPGSRPTSKLSNIGRQALGGNMGYAADGFTLQSNPRIQDEGTYKSNVSDGTFNLHRYNDNNDRRLEKLRGLGIESLPGQSEDLAPLDKLLERYNRS